MYLKNKAAELEVKKILGLEVGAGASHFRSTGIRNCLYFISEIMIHLLNTGCSKNTWTGLFGNLKSNLIFCFLKIHTSFFYKFRDQMHEIIQYILRWHHKQFSFFLYHFHMRHTTYPVKVFPILLTNYVLNFPQNDASFCMPFF